MNYNQYIMDKENIEKYVLIDEIFYKNIKGNMSIDNAVNAIIGQEINELSVLYNKVTTQKYTVNNFISIAKRIDKLQSQYPEIREKAFGQNKYFFNEEELVSDADIDFCKIVYNMTKYVIEKRYEELKNKIMNSPLQRLMIDLANEGIIIGYEESDDYTIYYSENASCNSFRRDACRDTIFGIL